jgi:L-threonylcarbamoyladenylate synthase
MIIVSEDISKAAEILNEENLVAIPTETVYGLAGNIAK